MSTIDVKDLFETIGRQAVQIMLLEQQLADAQAQLAMPPQVPPLTPAPPAVDLPQVPPLQPDVPGPDES